MGQEEKPPGGGGGGGGPGTLTTTPPPCDFCNDAPAVVYCRADTASLCLRCDREVHAANTVSCRHTRAILCDVCCAAPATFSCSCRGFLCSNCDFESHGGDHDHAVGHVRRGVEGYSGCPLAAEMATLVGVGVEECEKGKGEGLVGAESRWEMDQVFRMEDLIVPTTCHGFHALDTTPLIKNRSPPVGRHGREIFRQIREITKSDAADVGAFNEDIEPISELLNWDLNYSQFEGNFGLDTTQDSSNMTVPACEDGKWFSTNSNATTDTDSMEIPYEQYLVSTPEANLSNFVDMAEICPNTSQENNIQNTTTATTELVHVLPVKNGPNFVSVDRDTVISRYKEKRKARRYDKLVRYESRKVRADGRLRIKGRFAKADPVNNI